MKLKSSRFGTQSFPSDYDVVETATLNKTDLTGGNNKFYIIESHVCKYGKQFRLYSRYGRVGAHGVEEERIPEQNREALDAAFAQLKKEKTSKRKGYIEVKVAQSKMGSAIAQTMVLSDDVKKTKVKKTDSASKVKIEPTVAKLVTRLYAEAGQAVRSQLSGALNTTTENPLGTLTLGQIEDGRQVLQKIQKLIAKDASFKDSIKKKILDLSNEFYSAIPQTMDKRPTKREGKKAMETWLRHMALNNATKLDEKEDLLELLSDVEGMVSGFASDDVATKYAEIGCKYTWLDPADPKRKIVERYMLETRSRHHRWGVHIKNVWAMEVPSQKRHSVTMQKVGNVKPLFHGSRSANILGICKRGLLLRPPGVYITGSLYGNGLYFANQSSKSEQYSIARFGGSGSRYGSTYFMFVADVALGQIKEFNGPQTHLVRPPRGYDSVMGVKGYLLHDEFIIYDIHQHRLDYLIEFATR